ncbi:hypothetical protein JP75_06525 [Devosia riboflavina]|uniref:Uncharacterized protein n=1 Tax=Devosia riboflavina TaxID=46914 RepID=A0A087M4C1_9HYPH|nr:hypothetical protein [Devosia riboflavina]KFL31724.1 hypothetical protein JP75_06525 [Devosia riboflavina]
MQVVIVQAEHFSNPGRVLKAFRAHSDAIAEAVDLVNIMLKDDGREPCTAEDWEDALEQLQDAHGAQYCYVDLVPLEVL